MSVSWQNPGRGQQYASDYRNLHKRKRNGHVINKARYKIIKCQNFGGGKFEGMGPVYAIVWF